MPTTNSDVKLDTFNRRILETLHLHADLTNQELAERVGLSPSACHQRVKQLKEGGYMFNFHCEMDLDRICEHVLAYVEFKLVSNTPEARAGFEAAIADIPEFMDCLRLGDDADYISFTCARDLATLNALCDELSGDAGAGVERVRVRVILDRAKFYLGYPLAQLKWRE